MWLCSSGGPARETQSRSSGERWRGWDCLGLAIVREAGQGKGLVEEEAPTAEGTVRKEEGKPARNSGFKGRMVEEGGLRAGGKTRAHKVVVGAKTGLAHWIDHLPAD